MLAQFHDTIPCKGKFGEVSLRARQSLQDARRSIKPKRKNLRSAPRDLINAAISARLKTRTNGSHHRFLLPPPRPVTFGYRVKRIKKSAGSPTGTRRNQFSNLTGR